ncbi:MAG: response regulator [Candidatus Peribacteria bacterium]|nr:MAG: response regulator [Candidatus Peribacteria bacterium]
MVVEDHEILARNLVRYFAMKDISVDVALDGRDGLYKAATKYYDVVILDIQLPEMDGLEVCRALREKGKDVSIIMLTSRSTSDDIVTGLESGADDYLVKPFEYQELFARINALVRRRMKNHSNTLIKIDDIVLDIEKVEVYK